MKPGFISIPFKIEGESSGLTHAEGVAKFSPAGIVMEFETKFLGLMKTGYKDVRIPRSEIIDVTLKCGFFNTRYEKFFANKIVIRLNNYLTMSEIPSSKGTIVLKIQRQDRQRAEAAVAALEEKTLPEVREEELPPVGVRALFGDEADTKELE
jgi:hypothetical protein